MVISSSYVKLPEGILKILKMASLGVDILRKAWKVRPSIICK